MTYGEERGVLPNSTHIIKDSPSLSRSKWQVLRMLGVNDVKGDAGLHISGEFEIRSPSAAGRTKSRTAAAPGKPHSRELIT